MMHSSPTSSTAETTTESRKRFTVDEANRSLVYVNPVVRDVTAVYGRIVELRRELEDLDPGDPSADMERAYELAMDRLGDLVDELHLVGVELKDFEKGLIDFPAVHDGREILLCWQLGEDHVDHWHECDAGYATRQTVEALYE